MSAKKSKTFYITTALPYVNAGPHVGFAMEIIRADAIARAKKSEGYEVFFNTGTDDVTIPGTLLGDVYNIYYSAASFGTAGDPTTVDSGNPCFLKAENVTVTLNDGTSGWVSGQYVTKVPAGK